MESLKFLPKQYHQETLSLIERVVKIALQTRGRIKIDVLVDELDYIEEELRKDPNAFVDK